MLSIFFGTISYAQTEVVLEPDSGFLNKLIKADQEANVGVEKIYVLKRGATYFSKGVFANQGYKLHIKAEDGAGALPIIKPYQKDNGTIVPQLIRVFGDLVLENLHLDGDEGSLPWTNIIIQTKSENHKIDITGCTFVNAGQIGVMLLFPADYVKVDNCLFLNMGNLAYNNQGNGRVFDCRDSDVNLFSLTNSTFVNSIDRIVRHRGGGTMKEVIIDHCTMINSASYHGFMELGGIESFKMTNNLMMDCMGLGADQFDDERLIELDAHTEQIDGKAKMVWIGSIPDATGAPVPSTFEISNNIYSVSTEVQAYYDLVQGNKAVITEGPILTDYTAGKLSNAGTAFLKKDITLSDIPVSMTDFYAYQTSPTGLDYAKQITNAVSYDMKDYAYWTSTLDCKYTTSDGDFMGSDGFPVGDKRWGSVVNGLSNNEFNSDATKLLSYPNPFTNKLNVEFNLEQFSDVTIDIHDITGKLVRKLEMGNMGPGRNSVVIQKDNLQKGIYLMKLYAGGNSSYAKIIVE